MFSLIVEKGSSFSSKAVQGKKFGCPTFICSFANVLRSRIRRKGRGGRRGQMAVGTTSGNM